MRQMRTSLFTHNSVVLMLLRSRSPIMFFFSSNGFAMQFSIVQYTLSTHAVCCSFLFIDFVLFSHGWTSFIKDEPRSRCSGFDVGSGMGRVLCFDSIRDNHMVIAERMRPIITATDDDRTTSSQLRQLCLECPTEMRLFSHSKSTIKATHAIGCWAGWRWRSLGPSRHYLILVT